MNGTMSGSRRTEAGRPMITTPVARAANLSACGRTIEVDHRMPLGYYYNLAGELHEEASKYREDKDLINLYVALLRFSSLISETIPDHRDYQFGFLHRKQKAEFNKKLLDALEELEALQPDVQHQLDGLGHTSLRRSSRVVVTKEEEEECVILEFDPFNFKPPTFDFGRKLSLSDARPSETETETEDEDEDEDVSIIEERGPVACRDFPHSRHLCANYPFNTTAHETFCPQCYCYVCDVVAPCENWKGSSGHCHASDHDRWKVMRNRSQESGRQS